MIARPIKRDILLAIVNLAFVKIFIIKPINIINRPPIPVGKPNIAGVVESNTTDNINDIKDDIDNTPPICMNIFVLSAVRKDYLLPFLFLVLVGIRHLSYVALTYFYLVLNYRL